MEIDINIPNLCIIGVFKSGTTSLHRYLVNHPEISEGICKETHYLDEFVYFNTKSLKPNLSDYSNFYRNVKKSCYYLDSSPSYFYGSSKIIDYIKKNIPNAKFLLMLRNPVDRFTSYYNFIKSKNIINDDFESFFNKSLKKFELRDHLKVGAYENSLLEGIYSNFIDDWLKLDSNEFKILFNHDLKSDPMNVITDILNWLELDISTFYNNYNFRIENKTTNYNNKIAHKMASSISNHLNLRANLPNGLFYFMKNLYQKFNSSKLPENNNDKILKKLNEFYFDYNKELFNKINYKKTW